jgi:hypothetical protein
VLFDVTKGSLPKEGVTRYLSVSYPDKMHAFMSADQNFYISDDGGVTWNDTWIFRRIAALSFSDSLHGGYVYVPDCELCSDVHVTFTSDGGNTWGKDHYIGESPWYYLNGIQCVDNMHSTAIGTGGYIGHTTDGGATWNAQQSNTLNNLHGVCFGTVKAGTAVGLRGNIMRITTDEEPASSVKSVANVARLSIEVSPNPSKQFVTIYYSLPSSGLTKIEMYSVSGTLISSISAEYKSAGNYSMRFDESGLASGSYFCRITSNGLKAERELIIGR